MRILLLMLITISLSTFKGITQPMDTSYTKKPKENKKTGFNIGALPALAYDSDLGFQYGVVGNIYHYGDGVNYPKYNHSVYLEWTQTNTGYRRLQMLYDSEHLLKGFRVNGDITMSSDPLLNFFGFNGYNAYYNESLEEKNSPTYISKVFYTYDRSYMRYRLDIQRATPLKSLFWIAGLSALNIKNKRTDFVKLNKIRSNSDKLRDTTLLFDKYLQWGFVPENQKSGGLVAMAKAGLIYDTRDNEPNPMKGIWTEALLIGSPSFAGNKWPFAKLVLTHRQYFTLAPDKLNLAYRICYQTTIAGNSPYFMLPFVFSSYNITEGLGGGKSLRGILRNRIEGEGFVMTNIEMRYKFLKFRRFNQNFYGAISGFFDAGRVTKKFKMNTTSAEGRQWLQQGRDETWHPSSGLGLHAVMNQNFIVTVNYGKALNAADGTSGLYVNLDFLF